MADNSDEYNRGGLIAFSASIIFCLIFFIYISFVDKGVDLKEVSVEAAAGAVGGVTAFDPKQITEPWQENADFAIYGAKVYKNNCAICHGSEGKGDGAAGATLVPPPRNFVEGKWKIGGSSIALYTSIEKGLDGTSMASFKHLPKVDRWALVQYIRSITQNKEADDAAKLSAFGQTAE